MPRCHQNKHSVDHFLECLLIARSIILATQSFGSIGETIHEIREDGEERHQEGIDRQHDGALT